jgi:F-type H+-transporting ATPase subunit a
MGLEFLQRVRKTGLWAGAIVALLVARYLAPRDGLAAALGTLWSLVNLALIERLVVALTGPDHGQPAALRRAGIALAGMLGLFAFGAALLATLPPQSLLWGFLVPLLAIVLKAGSLLILGSHAWRRFARDPRGVAGAIVAVALTSWIAVPRWVGAAGGSEAGHAESEGPEKFANIVTVLTRAFPNRPWTHFLHEFEPVLFAMLVGALLCLVAFLASRNPKMIPGPLQNVAEFAVESLYNFVVSILGPAQGARFFPLLATLFVYILAMNLFGLIPFMDSPTSNLNVTFALGLTIFVYAQWVGIRGLGIAGYFDHLLGNPRNLTGWILAPLMLPIHVLGELAKPISLSCRLFGNIFGEDMLMVAFATLGVSMLGFVHSPVGLPMHAIFYPLALLTSALQALVFTVLSTIYILLMLPHEDHEHDEAHEIAHTPHEARRNP